MPRPLSIRLLPVESYKVMLLYVKQINYILNICIHCCSTCKHLDLEHIADQVSTINSHLKFEQTAFLAKVNHFDLRLETQPCLIFSFCVNITGTRASWLAFLPQISAIKVFISFTHSTSIHHIKEVLLRPGNQSHSDGSSPRRAREQKECSVGSDTEQLTDSHSISFKADLF